MGLGDLLTSLPDQVAGDHGDKEGVAPVLEPGVSLNSDCFRNQR